MRAELQESWTEKEEARTVERGAMADVSAFRALWKACRKLRRSSKQQGTGT